MCSTLLTCAHFSLVLTPPILVTPELVESEVVFGRGSPSPLLLLLLVVSDTPESSNTTSSVFSTGGTSVTGLYVCVCVCVCVHVSTVGTRPHYKYKHINL